MRWLRERLDRITAGGAWAPLLLLFGLNAVDELDRTAFAILVPEIRDHFRLDNAGILGVVGLVGIFALAGQLGIGYYADRMSRVRLALLGASIWALFTLGSGLAPTIAVLVAFRSSTSIGQAVNTPTHNSLLSDHYPPEARVRVFGVHRAANSLGQFIGPILGGGLAYVFGTWRAPFLIFWVPTAVLIVLALRYLKEPVRGEQERRAMGGSDEAVSTEEAPPSFGEAWRICYQVKTLRRIWLSLPFIGLSLVGLGSIYSIYYERVFGLNEVERGLVAAMSEPFQIVGIAIGIPFALHFAKRDPGLMLRFIAIVGTLVAAAIVGFAASAHFPLAVAMNILIAAPLAVLAPGILAVLSLAMPPRARALGFAIGSLYVIPALILLPVVGALVDDVGTRVAVASMAPVFLIGAFIIASAGSFVAGDIHKVRTSTLARAEVRAARLRGEAKLLLVKDLDVAYDSVQVLFGVDFEVDEGEIVALLGTNGAGKSTLLKAVSGLVEPSAGATVFDGRDTTYATPHEIAARGVIQVPGGKGVLPGLTVEENLRIAGWLHQRDPDYLREATERVLGYFPVLRERWEQPAGNLSGGEQQMLTLGMAFISKPRLLMIDELSLGLAPVIVEQLLEVVRAIKEQGTTIILVEQSVNVALNVADTAYFMEKGEIRFHGATRELLERPDILRSVFLEGAASTNGRRKTAATSKRPRRRRAPAVITASGLSKSYGGLNAVDRVSFELRRDEILGVIGPNGAGKTTLFDLVSGFVPSDEGELIFDGVDVSGAAAEVRARLGLGRSFQDARLFPSLTVGETIAVALERHIEVRDPIAAMTFMPSATDSEREIQSRTEKLIELLGLGAFRDKFIHELSTGSRRIVDLACVLAHEPTAILLDEPSSGIAQREAEALGPLIERIRDATGACLMVIEHDIPLVTSVADRMIALETGRIVAEGTPREVVRHEAVVASYLGSDQSVIQRSGKLKKHRKAPAKRRSSRSTSSHPR